MKIITPIILIIGLLYALYMAAFYWWSAAVYAYNPQAVEFCTVWWFVALFAIAASVAGLVLYAVELYRKRDKGRYGKLSLLYIVMWVVLYLGAILYAKYYLN
ncbi:MAG: hypothetical protein IKT79_01160 [Akkermansia sp.]|nr:hypothetical protein [Akkermansia sp.]